MPAERAVDEALERLERWQPVTNAFSQVYAGEARAEAKRDLEGPLAGVPVAVKDLFDVAGHETSGCSAAYRGNVAEKTAPVVRRLQEAGAVVIGKTNMHELAFGTTNLISDCGPCHNPWDPARIPGGSSGGSAAAVASRVVSIALGTDTGGSIRAPSSFCGVFGLKPTHGALSLEGVMPLAVSLDCPGPIAVTARDLATAWEVLAGQSAEGSAARSVAVLDTVRCTDEVDAAVRVTADALEALGATSDRVPDGVADAPELWVEAAAPEFARDHAALLEKLDQVHQIIGAFLQYGGVQTDERRKAAEEGRAAIAAWFDQQLEDHDVVLMPATPYPAPRDDEEEIEVRSGAKINVHIGGPSEFTRAVNLAGLPALALPAGRASNGMPLGVQLVGRKGSESLLLATAEALERHDSRFSAGDPPPLPS